MAFQLTKKPKRKPAPRINIDLNHETFSRLQAAAAKAGISKSETIRQLIEFGLNELESSDER